MKPRSVLIMIVTAMLALTTACGSGQGTPSKNAAPAPTQPSVDSVRGEPPPTVPVPAAPASNPAPQPTVQVPTPTPDPSSKVGKPVKIQIPKIQVDAGFEYLGLTKDGGMDAPKDPDKVGWYQLGPKPGATGNALLDGHVDWGQKTRVFWGLKNLNPGDSVIITDETGAKYEFVVQWSKWFDANAPVDETFAQGDQKEVTLITCGGEFDHTTKQYLSRLVVRAKLK